MTKVDPKIFSFYAGATVWLGRLNERWTKYTKKGPDSPSQTVSPPARILRHPGNPEVKKYIVGTWRGKQAEETHVS